MSAQRVPPPLALLSRSSWDSILSPCSWGKSGVNYLHLQFDLRCPRWNVSVRKRSPPPEHASHKSRPGLTKSFPDSSDINRTAKVSWQSSTL
jgi:hypothetical protein